MACFDRFVVVVVMSYVLQAASCDLFWSLSYSIRVCREWGFGFASPPCLVVVVVVVVDVRFGFGFGFG